MWLWHQMASAVAHVATREQKRGVSGDHKGSDPLINEILIIQGNEDADLE